jgi:two-component system phosphate regulon sensor histidine kinase PhoR
VSRLRDTLGSYRVRLILGYLLVVLLLAAVWAASLFGPLDAAVRKQQRDALATVARGVAGVVAAQGIPSGTQTRKLVEETGWRVTIVAKDGKVLADSSTDPATMENHASRPEIGAALDGRVGTAERTSRTTGVAQLYVAVPSRVRGSAVAVRLSEPVMALADISGQTRGMSLVALMAALILAGVVAWRLATAATKPVAELADSARRMAAGDLAGAVPPAPGELGQLSSALTDLRDQMRDRVAGL